MIYDGKGVEWNNPACTQHPVSSRCTIDGCVAMQQSRQGEVFLVDGRQRRTVTSLCTCLFQRCTFLGKVKAFARTPASKLVKRTQTRSLCEGTEWVIRGVLIFFLLTFTFPRQWSRSISKLRLIFIPLRRQPISRIAVIFSFIILYRG